IERLRDAVQHTRVDTAHPFFVSRGIEFRDRPTFAGLIRRPEIRMEELIAEGVLLTESLRREDIVSLETSIKYEGYLKQQDREVEKLRKAESKRLRPDLEYAAMPGISRGIVEKLNRIRPPSIALGRRIP